MYIYWFLIMLGFLVIPVTDGEALLTGRLCSRRLGANLSSAKRTHLVSVRLGRLSTLRILSKWNLLIVSRSRHGRILQRAACGFSRGNHYLFTEGSWEFRGSVKNVTQLWKQTLGLLLWASVRRVVPESQLGCKSVPSVCLGGVVQGTCVLLKSPSTQ